MRDLNNDVFQWRNGNVAKYYTYRLVEKHHSIVELLSGGPEIFLESCGITLAGANSFTPNHIRDLAGVYCRGVSTCLAIATAHRGEQPHRRLVQICGDTLTATLLASALPFLFLYWRRAAKRFVCR